MLSPYLSAGVSKKVARLLVLVTQLEAVPLYEWTHVSGMQPRERLVPTYQLRSSQMASSDAASHFMLISPII